MSAVSFVAYRGLLAEPVLRRLAVADACVRMPQGMVSITVLLVDAALSATEVAVTGYVRHHHALWASGPLLAEVSIGCILGSLLLGPRSRSLPAMTAGFAGGLALLTAAGLDAPLLAVAAPLAGLFLGPVLATLFGAAAAAAPSGSGTETQAWLNSIMNGGAAAGAAIAGAFWPSLWPARWRWARRRAPPSGELAP